MDPSVLLDVRHLRAHFFSDEGTVRAVDGVDFRIMKGETLGVVGESGCGKSVTAQSILQILPKNGRIVSDEVLLQANGKVVDLAKPKPNGREIRNIRGKEITMMFQEPMTCLSPVHTIGNQIEEAIRLHRSADRKEAREIAVDMLRKCGIPEPERRVDAYPHQLSGGMRQRAMIAMSLSCRPRLLIADEPTTALDVTVQMQILALLKRLQESEANTSIILISHDLGVVAQMCERVCVMYAGTIVEAGTTEEVLENPRHPYTVGLIESIPRLDVEGQTLNPIPGVVADPIRPPPGCKFNPRCAHVHDLCRTARPDLRGVDGGHAAACHLYAEAAP